MPESSQNRALKSYRQRLSQRGVARFEVLGLENDRELLRALARKLTENDAEARLIRESVRSKLAGETRKKGGIIEALLRSPLAASGLDFVLEISSGREIDL